MATTTSIIDFDISFYVSHNSVSEPPDPLPVPLTWNVRINNLEVTISALGYALTEIPYIKWKSIQTKITSVA